MPFTIVRQDITKMKVDAIVNAANTELAMGGGVCGAIFNAAGAVKLQAACRRLAPICTGQAVLTPGFALPAKYVIHAAGPIYRAQDSAESETLLSSAYSASLRLAAEHKCESIAFPLISSGIYGYPKDEALRVASSAIREFLCEHDMDVYLAVFDKAALDVSEKLMGAVESYIDEHYVQQHSAKRRDLLQVEHEALSDGALLSRSAYIIPERSTRPLADMPSPAMAAPHSGIDELVARLDEPFSTALLRLIDARGKTDAEVYKRANIDRRLFSKIRGGNGYTPGKRTILALAVALELSLAETDDLLERAGYALSHSRKLDVIVEYFIVSGQYDIFKINEVLFKYDQQTLGG